MSYTDSTEGVLKDELEGGTLVVLNDEGLELEALVVLWIKEDEDDVADFSDGITEEMATELEL